MSWPGTEDLFECVWPNMESQEKRIKINYYKSLLKEEYDMAELVGDRVDYATTGEAVV